MDINVLVLDILLIEFVENRNVVLIKGNRMWKKGFNKYSLSK